EIGVSFSTIFFIVTRKNVCSRKTAERMIVAGWFKLSDLYINIPNTSASQTPDQSNKHKTTKSFNYKRGYEDGVKDGAKNEYNRGYKEGYAKGKKDGEDIGYKEGYANGTAVANPYASVNSYTNTAASSGSINKLKQLLNLKNGTEFNGEAGAAN